LGSTRFKMPSSNIQYVTTLEDDGPGSLRQILTDATNYTTVLFKVKKKKKIKTKSKTIVSNIDLF